MNITREKLNDLDLSIKVEIEENDYSEAVSKSLKRMQQNATVHGFRKGKAPMQLITRMYRPSIVADEVQRILSDSIYKYVSDEHLDIFGYPITNDEKTATVDFENQTSFVFYLDAALKPTITVSWDKIDVKMPHIKVAKKDIDEQINTLSRRYGKFETPDTICEGSIIYGKAEELDENGAVKEGGVSTYAMFNINDIKDDEIRNSLIGKPVSEDISLDVAKVFDTKTIAEKFRISQDQAKAFKSIVKFSGNSCSHITPAEINEALFEQAFPGRNIKTEKDLRKVLTDELNEINDTQCRAKYSNDVYKALLDNFDATLPEEFLKRWIARTNEVSANEVEENWTERYLPSIKWELILAELEKIKPIEPTENDIVNHIKKILANRPSENSDETEEQRDAQLTEAARTIAKDRENVRQVVDQLFSDNLCQLFVDQLKPETEEMTQKQFYEK